MDLADLEDHRNLMRALVRWARDTRGLDACWYRESSCEITCSICFGRVRSVEYGTRVAWLADHQAKHLAQLDQTRLAAAEVILAMWADARGWLNGPECADVIPIIWPEGHPVPYVARDVG